MRLCEQCWEALAKHQIEVEKHRRVGMCNDCHAEATSFEVLLLDAIKALPREGDARGIYFLWNADDLQYVGQSMAIGNRVTDHERNYIYGRLRSRPAKRIKFDRFTALVIDQRPFADAREIDRLRNRMLIIERAYIEKYRPPFNTEWFL